MNRDIRNRIVEMRSVPAAELLDNRRNWRRHPAAQREALHGILAEVGIADTLVAYRSEREGGRLTLIDGHLRHADFAVEWPTLILDVSAAEKLGRICYGMEIHPPYISVVLERYLAFTGDTPRLADG